MTEEERQRWRQWYEITHRERWSDSRWERSWKALGPEHSMSELLWSSDLPLSYESFVDGMRALLSTLENTWGSAWGTGTSEQFAFLLKAITEKDEEDNLHGSQEPPAL